MTFHDLLLAQVQGNNILLFILLVVLFIVAYRVLRAVVNTAIVAILSGSFLVVLDYLGIGPAVTVNRFMLFMVMGTALFIVYSAAATVIRTTSGVLGLTRRMAGWVTVPVRKRKKKKPAKEKEIVLEELKDE